ncbi:dioxygenase [Microbacterium dauci]|uniref:Dioxygenase n=1 Tax=Microbacterium dauci TaxID=3048008 RepID=A0ABT6ZDP9_9MICO|nr:dioxygenase [Microbacterium sp. LX3-4]MDJ1113762.1 dioxygenase [Microbacterium sp. LX3-4]
MATGKSGRTRGTAQERERARLYDARRRFHESLGRRRRRDNVIAGVAGGALILAILGGQIAYYTLGPGAPVPEPAPTSTPTPTTSPAPTVSPSPTVSPTPTPTP